MKLQRNRLGWGHNIELCPPGGSSAQVVERAVRDCVHQGLTMAGGWGADALGCVRQGGGAVPGCAHQGSALAWVWVAGVPGCVHKGAYRTLQVTVIYQNTSIGLTPILNCDGQKTL